MTRTYETVYIFDSTLEDAVIAEKLAKFHALLQVGDTATVDHWGRRQLAYKIGKRDTGYYVVARFATEPKLLPEYERQIKLDEGVVRYLVSLHEHELGAPALPEGEVRAAVGAADDDDDEE